MKADTIVVLVCLLALGLGLASVAAQHSLFSSMPQSVVPGAVNADPVLTGTARDAAGGGLFRQAAALPETVDISTGRAGDI